MHISNNTIVIDMPSANVSEDGSFVEMVLKNSDKTVQIIRFSPDKMMLFLAKVFDMFLFQKIQKESKAGLVVVQPLEAVSTMAQEDMHHKAVILQFRLLSGVPVALTISPQEADEFYNQLGKAIEKVKIPIPKYNQ